MVASLARLPVGEALLVGEIVAEEPLLGGVPGLPDRALGVALG